MRKFEISRRNERKPQPQVAWPAAMFIKDHHLKSSWRPRTEYACLNQVSGFPARMAICIISRVKNLSTAGPCTSLRFRQHRKGNLVDPASNQTLVSKTNSFSRRQISRFRARMAIFTISRVKNLSTARPCTNLRFREERKGHLVDPASSHMLVSKTNSFSRGQVSGFGARINFYHFPCKEFINGRAMYKFEILQEKEKETWLILPVVIRLSQRLIHSAVAKSLDLEHGWQFLPFPV